MYIHLVVSDCINMKKAFAKENLPLRHLSVYIKFSNNHYRRIIFYNTMDKEQVLLNTVRI